MTPQVRGLLLSIGAGLCTSIGGSCVFFLHSFQRLPLAVTMGLSAGVMVYVSFVEIFHESTKNIHLGLVIQWKTEKDDPRVNALSYLFSTLCFFGGWWLACLMDFGMHFFVDRCGPGKRPTTCSSGCPLVEPADTADIELNAAAAADFPAEENEEGSSGNDRVCNEKQDDISENTKRKSISVACDTMSAAGVRYCKDTTETRANSTPEDHRDSGQRSSDDSAEDRRSTQTLMQERKKSPPLKGLLSCTDRLARSATEDWEVAHAQECFHRDNRKFFEIGIFTALALGLHNLPEGMATFIGSLASPKLGVSVAIAIGIHNIPEGFAVSIPLYFGTGKKWLSFFYAFITGLAEPCGALLGWAIMGNNTNPVALGIAFGFVCGIMVNIALIELLPSAVKYDPCNQVTSKSFVGGMFVMALSLVLVQFAPG